ncbi:MAG: hypothetical protein ACRDQF_03370 [Thermocrispum sp.]
MPRPKATPARFTSICGTRSEMRGRLAERPRTQVRISLTWVRISLTWPAPDDEEFIPQTAGV